MLLLLLCVQVLLQEREQQQLAQQLQQEHGDDAADGASKQQQSKKDSSPLRALILTPTRELALQVCGHVKVVAKHVDISSMCSSICGAGGAGLPLYAVLTINVLFFHSCSAVLTCHGPSSFFLVGV